MALAENNEIIHLSVFSRNRQFENYTNRIVNYRRRMSNRNLLKKLNMVLTHYA